MSNRTFIPIVFFIVFVSFGTLEEENTIVNPVMSDYTIHDVSVIEYQDTFYAFASCVVPRDKSEILNYTCVQIFRSSDMVNWTYYKQATSDENMNIVYTSVGDTKKDKYRIWAPDIIKYKDKLLLFVALRHSFDDSKIAVFESDDICHDFVFKNIVVSNDEKDRNAFFSSKEIIDPYPLIFKNKLYLVFGSFSRDDKGRLLGGRKGIGTYIVPLKYDREIRMKKNPIFISDYYEGVNIQRHGKNFILFGTNGNLNNYTYKIDYAKSKKLVGPYLNSFGQTISDTININYGTPILQTLNSHQRFNGFGCMSNIIIDKSGRSFVLVHGHDIERKPIQMKTSEQERYAFLLELLWDKNGNPYFDMDAIQTNGIKMPQWK